MRALYRSCENVMKMQGKRIYSKYSIKAISFKGQGEHVRIKQVQLSINSRWMTRAFAKHPPRGNYALEIYLESRRSISSEDCSKGLTASIGSCSCPCVCCSAFTGSTLDCVISVFVTLFPFPIGVDR